MEQITKAINAVMTEINWVAKNMTVWSWNNSYQWVADKDVKQLIRDSMIKNWLSILPIWWTPKIQIDRWEEQVEDYKTKQMVTKTKQSIFTEIETEYLLLHTSWESIKVYWYWQWVDTQDKWAGKATTYALKNTLLNMFLIPTWVDTDNTHSDDLDIPQKPKYENNDDLPWIWDKNIDNLSDLIADWKTFTMADIRKKYKVSKANALKLNNIWII